MGQRNKEASEHSAILDPWSGHLEPNNCDSQGLPTHVHTIMSHAEELSQVTWSLKNPDGFPLEPGMKLKESKWKLKKTQN